MENKSNQTNQPNNANQSNNTNEAQTPKVLKPIKRQKSRKAVFMGRGRNVSRSKDRSRNRSKSNSFKLLKLNQETPHPPAYPPPPPPPKPLSKELIQEHTFVSNSPRRRHNAKKHTSNRTSNRNFGINEAKSNVSTPRTPSPTNSPTTIALSKINTRSLQSPIQSQSPQSPQTPRSMQLSPQNMLRNELRRTTSSVSIDSTSSESSNASNASKASNTSKTSNTSNKSEVYYTNNFSKNIPQYQLHNLRDEFKWDLETGTIVQNNYTLTPNSHISNSNFPNFQNSPSSQNSPHSSQSSLAPPMPMPLLHPTLIKAPPKKRLTLCGRFKCIFSVILSNTIFVCANIKIKLRDNMLLGTEHTIKILPDCDSPARRNSKVYSAITDDEKKAIVLNDPKFGMFSLFKYQVTRGYKNHVLKHKNTMYCSHVFSTLAFLPILIFVSQWSIFISLAAHEIMRFDGNFCPNKSTWEKKLLMFAVAAVYFTKSFSYGTTSQTAQDLKKCFPQQIYGLC